jgi:hypothetical protein
VAECRCRACRRKARYLRRFSKGVTRRCARPRASSRVPVENSPAPDPTTRAYGCLFSGSEGGGVCRMPAGGGSEGGGVCRILPHAGRRRERGWWGLPHAGRRSCRTKAQCTTLRHPLLPGECGNALGVRRRPVDQSPGFACSFLSSTTGEHHPGGTVADVAPVIGRGGHCHADAAGRENSSRTHAKQSKRCHSVPIKRHSNLLIPLNLSGSGGSGTDPPGSPRRRSHCSARCAPAPGTRRARRGRREPDPGELGKRPNRSSSASSSRPR